MATLPDISIANLTTPLSLKQMVGDTMVFLVSDALQLGNSPQVFDKEGGILQRALSGEKFKGKAREVLSVVLPGKSGPQRAVLVGIGNPQKMSPASVEAVGGTICKTLNALGSQSAVVVLDMVKNTKIKGAAMAAQLALGAHLKSYRFDKYRTKEKPEQKPTLQKLQFLTADAVDAKKLWEKSKAIATGVYLSRDLSSEPPNVLYPETFAKRARDEMAGLNVKIEIFDEAQLKKMGMGAFIGVGQGSVRPPRMVVLQYNGNPKDKSAPLAFVGKGITFDTGGISIKPAQGMEDMKWDMSGAGVVLGLFKNFALRKAQINAVGVMALAENMPDGNAQRPGDVVTSMSGQTIEVLNTDAEGRLVLADALWYCQEKFKPALIVDLATLTGAVIMALSHEYAGVMGNDQKLLQQLQAAGDVVDEKLWPLPMCDAFDEMVNSKIADVQNISSGKGAGSSTAGQFLQRFIKEGQSWAHLDIAGTAWVDKERGVVPAGASGFGVRLLDQFVQANYEAK